MFGEVTDERVVARRGEKPAVVVQKVDQGHLGETNLCVIDGQFVLGGENEDLVIRRALIALGAILVLVVFLGAALFLISPGGQIWAATLIP